MKPPEGTTPAVLLTNPKYPHNVGAAVRAASCFGVSQVWFTGDRVSLIPQKNGKAKKPRLPREERMRGYADVELRQCDRPFDEFSRGVTPIAVELRDSSENMLAFEHPENPLYVFGPEDGHLGSTMARHCHRFLVIPTRHCTNLAAAVYLVLYDRLMKQFLNGEIEAECASQFLKEDRSWTDMELY